MAFTTRVKSFTKSKPFYAFAGATAYAFETLSKLPQQLRKQRREVRETAKELPSRARKTVAENLPEPAREYTDTVTTQLNELYDELAVKGRRIVAKVSGEAAQELEEVSEFAMPPVAPPVAHKGETASAKPPPARRTSRTKTPSRA